MRDVHKAMGISRGLFKWVFWFQLLLAYLPLHFVFAFEPVPEPAVTPRLPKPQALSPVERISDKSKIRIPSPPRRYVNGEVLHLTNELHEAPLGSPMRILGQAPVIQEVPNLNQREHQPGKYRWHPYDAWNYCHLLSGGRHWYGWRTGEKFHWVLWKSGRFWWRDPQAKRWLYFDRGYWWWQGPQRAPTFEVLLEDGRYRVCHLDGNFEDESPMRQP